jgi:hypothetical protein
LIEKLDIKTLIWTFRNAGGDKISTVNQVLRIGFSYLLTNPKDLRKAQRELAEMQDETEQLQDVDQATFVKGIKQSQTLSGLW